jgi:hypothetical protein
MTLSFFGIGLLEQRQTGIDSHYIFRQSGSDRSPLSIKSTQPQLS